MSVIRVATDLVLTGDAGGKLFKPRVCSSGIYTMWGEIKCIRAKSMDANAMEKEMATHSSILAWEILWTEEPGGLQSMGSQRIGHD